MSLRRLVRKASGFIPALGADLAHAKFLPRSSPPPLRRFSHSSSAPGASSLSAKASASLSMVSAQTLNVLHQVFPLDQPVRFGATVLGIFALMLLLRYREAIRKRIQQLQKESWIFGAGLRMVRITDHSDKTVLSTGAFQNLNLLQLNDAFIERNKNHPDLPLTTLGDYMSTLRPKGLPASMAFDDLPSILQREIEAGLTAGLLRALGPNLGRALLPAVGSGFVQAKAAKLAASIAGKWMASASTGTSGVEDKAGIPLPLMTLLAVADANARLNSETGGVEDVVEEGKASNLLDKFPGAGMTAMDKMVMGEVANGPSFSDEKSREMGLVREGQVFVMARDFEKAIAGMEARLGVEADCGGQRSTALKVAQEDAVQQEEDRGEMSVDSISFPGMKKPDSSAKKAAAYDPEDRSLSEPVPVNPRLFPDLHLGYGAAKSSHTKREILKMRLLALLLNKLGANYFKRVNHDDSLFSVEIGGRVVSTPSDFVQALIDSGHKVQVVPTSRLTTFGVGMCIKELDGSWTNVPLGVFLESGYEDKDGNMAPCMLPHSGLDMYISGPLVGHRADGTPSELALQHFIGIEGFCGWHTNANPLVPFNESVPMGERLSGQDVVRAVRISGLYANVLNGLATELGLPFGGYGLTAVCNDSAAIVQYILYGDVTIFPMTSIGRFMQRTMRYADKFRDRLRDLESLNPAAMEAEIAELGAITDAMRKLPSDINAAPSNSKSAARRMLRTLQPSLPFVLMSESKRVMESILEEEEKAEDRMREDSRSTADHRSTVGSRK